MLTATIVMGTLALALLGLAYSKGDGQHVAGLKTAGGMFVQIMPILVAAFVVAGMAQVLIPQETLSRWVGESSGVKGILIGTVAGGLTPGGPYVSLPVLAGLMKAGAGVGTLVAFLTAWSLWAVARIPMEVGILGWRFTFIRIACTFFFPPLAGLIARLFFSGWK